MLYTHNHNTAWAKTATMARVVQKAQDGAKKKMRRCWQPRPRDLSGQKSHKWSVGHRIPWSDDTSAISRIRIEEIGRSHGKGDIIQIK
jgi:hypothetical protein